MKTQTNLELITTLRDLMDISIRIDNEHPLKVKCTYVNGLKLVRFSLFAEYRGMYNFNNEILTFVLDNTAFVVPCFENAWNAIYSANLKMDPRLYCPLSFISEYPIDYKSYWENLKEKAVIQKQLDTYNLCKKYSLNKNINCLDDSIIDLCTEITPDGIYIDSDDHKIFPFIIQKSDIKGFIGHYNYNYFNKFIIFVHYDGRTYYSYNSDVLFALLNNNYVKDRNLIIPKHTLQSL